MRAISVSPCSNREPWPRNSLMSDAYTERRPGTTLAMSTNGTQATPFERHTRIEQESLSERHVAPVLITGELGFTHRGSPLHETDMLRRDAFPGRLRNLLPHKQVHPKRQIALFERFAQVGDSGALFRRREHDQIQVGMRTGGSLNTGTVGPDRHFRKMLLEKRQNGRAVPGVEVQFPAYSHVSPIIIS